MRLDCKVIEDLLPLYIDNMCSEQSRKLVEEHLLECENCRCMIERTQAVEIVHIEPEKPVADKAVKKSFKKIRFRWIVSVVAIMIIIPAIFLGLNQYHGRGIHYTNIREMHIGNEFMKCLAEGNYEKAYRYVDIDGLKQEWSERWFDEEKLENIQSDGLVKFCEYGKKVEEKGGISEYKYVGISLAGYDSNNAPFYQMVFKVMYNGEQTLFDVMVSDDGVEYFGGSGSFVTDPLAQFAIWSEYLWQDYEGCYYDPDLKEYVYLNK